MLPVLRMGVQVPLYQDNSYNIRQLQGAILVETNFFDIYLCSTLCFLVLKHFIYFTLYNCIKIDKSK
jgi:hypothetical protein